MLLLLGIHRFQELLATGSVIEIDRVWIRLSQIRVVLREESRAILNIALTKGIAHWDIFLLEYLWQREINILREFLKIIQSIVVIGGDAIKWVWTSVVVIVRWRLYENCFFLVILN